MDIFALGALVAAVQKRPVPVQQLTRSESSLSGTTSKTDSVLPLLPLWDKF